MYKLSKKKSVSDHAGLDFSRATLCAAEGGGPLWWQKGPEQEVLPSNSTACLVTGVLCTCCVSCLCYVCFPKWLQQKWCKLFCTHCACWLCCLFREKNITVKGNDEYYVFCHGVSVEYVLWNVYRKLTVWLKTEILWEERERWNPAGEKKNELFFQPSDILDEKKKKTDKDNPFFKTTFSQTVPIIFPSL